MKQTINFSMFVDGFSNRKDNFSYSGLKAMFEYFEKLDDDCGQEMEFDPIAICCEFTEADYDYFIETYDIHAQLDLSVEELDEMDEDKTPILDWLREHTQVIVVDENTIIIQDF